jgi:hypothetical protein
MCIMSTVIVWYVNLWNGVTVIWCSVNMMKYKQYRSTVLHIVMLLKDISMNIKISFDLL